VPEGHEQVREHLAGDRDPELGGVGEIERPLSACLVPLLEHHLLARAVQGAPLVHAPLQRAQQREPVQLTVTPSQLG
jgi:hypothetical protein